MLIDLEKLSVVFEDKRAVDEVSLQMAEGERVAVVGESGSGKSTLARALIGLVSKPGQVCAKRFRIDGQDMMKAADKDWRRLRGRKLGLLLQDPRYCLHPTMTIGRQIAETGERNIAERLGEVELSPDIALRYPHQVSGGQGARAYLAMVLAQRPRLLIADEPTSALDPPLALRMMELIGERIKAHGMGLLLITHDILLAGQHGQRLLVMQDGRVVEEMKPDGTPRHPFTRRLFDAIPRMPC
jgi:peptide/nickel transport system ATP-binding protein